MHDKLINENVIEEILLDISLVDIFSKSKKVFRINNFE